MKFKAFCQIGPPWLFGLPQDGMTVAPTPGRYESDVVHAKMHFKVKHGALSKFRTDSEAIRSTFTISGVHFELVDNFAELTFEAESPEVAFSIAQEAMESFLRTLSLYHGQYFYSKISGIESEGKTGYAESQLFSGRYGFYNLEQFKESIEKAIITSGLLDARLQKALRYYEHALFIANHLVNQLDPRSNQQPLLISAVFLNYWKAATCILGDPSRKKDRYPKRYKDLGITEEIKTKCDQLNILRNDYDVAHYSLRVSDLERVKQEFSKAQELAGEIIKHYQEHLKSKQDNASGQP